MRYIVKPDWAGQPCAILAGGPSLKPIADDLSKLLRGKVRVITINDSWQLAPWADVCYFGDATWWRQQQDSNPRTRNGEYGFHDMIYKAANWVTIANFAEHPQVKCLWTTGQSGLETNPAALRNGSNSGYAAINLAYHYGVARIILLGYDMKCQGAVTHWHSNPRPPAPMFEVQLNTFLPHFESLVEPLRKAGVDVVNATPDSALRCWPYLPIEEALGKPWAVTLAASR